MPTLTQCPDQAGPCSDRPRRLTRVPRSKTLLRVTGVLGCRDGRYGALACRYGPVGETRLVNKDARRLPGTAVAVAGWLAVALVAPV